MDCRLSRGGDWPVLRQSVGAAPPLSHLFPRAREHERRDRLHRGVHHESGFDSWCCGVPAAIVSFVLWTSLRSLLRSSPFTFAECDELTDIVVCGRTDTDVVRSTQQFALSTATAEWTAILKGASPTTGISVAVSIQVFRISLGVLRHSESSSERRPGSGREPKEYETLVWEMGGKGLDFPKYASVQSSSREGRARGRGLCFLLKLLLGLE